MPGTLAMIRSGKILMSTAWTGSLPLPDDVTRWGDVEIVPRSSDWGLRGLRKRLHHIDATIRLLWQARACSAVIICTSCIEIVLAPILRPLICPGVKLVAYDFLIPSGGRASDTVLRALRRYDLFFCIRTGDATTLHRRFGIPRSRLRFAPFPVRVPAETIPHAERSEVVYSGGTAHRDWTTTVAGIDAADVPAIISTASPLDLTASQRDLIDARPLLRPDDARDIVRSSAVVAVICEPTNLPSGPLVLLDALALGAAVVVTDVNGTRDYVEHDRTAIVVPPHDPDALAAGLRRLIDDADLRERLSAQARLTCRERFSAEELADRVLTETRRLLEPDGRVGRDRARRASPHPQSRRPTPSR